MTVDFCRTVYPLFIITIGLIAKWTLNFWSAVSKTFWSRKTKNGFCSKTAQLLSQRISLTTLITWLTKLKNFWEEVHKFKWRRWISMLHLHQRQMGGWFRTILRESTLSCLQQKLIQIKLNLLALAKHFGKKMQKNLMLFMSRSKREQNCCTYCSYLLWVICIFLIEFTLTDAYHSPVLYVLYYCIWLSFY